jgi:hypothetical protein
MKKKIKSLITDDLFESKNDPKVNTFGNFRIIGEIELIAVNKSDSLSIDLYFNHYSNKFFVVIKYPSGKYWVQIFNYNVLKISEFDDIDEIKNKVISRVNLSDEYKNVLIYDHLDYLFTYINENCLFYELRRI